MRKFVFALLFVCFFTLPTNIKGAGINRVTLQGNYNVAAGEELTITLSATTSNYQPKEGIWIVASEIHYNSSLFTLVGVSAPGYNTVWEYTNDGMVIVSEIIENATIPGMCVSGILHCGTYTLTLNFKANSISEDMNTEISVYGFGIGTLNMIEDREYGFEDIIETDYSEFTSHYIRISASSIPITNEEPIIPEGDTIKPESKTKTTESSVASDNNYLKSLIIADYRINFDKNTLEYSVNIGEDVTSLNIIPITDDIRASHKITGNENLTDGSIITIRVSAENGKTKNYKIKVNKIVNNVGKNDVEPSETPTENEETKPQNYNSMIKNITIIVGIILGVIGLIGLIILINNIRNNRSLNKLLKDFDKE